VIMMSLRDSGQDMLFDIVLVRMRAISETLSQVLYLISRARDEGLSLDDVEGIIADWLSEIDKLYLNRVYEDRLFRSLIEDRLNLTKRVLRMKRSTPLPSSSSTLQPSA